MNKRFVLSKESNPNYLCSICRLGETFPIEGADKLVKTVVNGYDIVIGKDYKEGDIVVYFPVETAISEMYLSANNLFERSEFERNANADSVKEYLIELENADNENDTQKAEELSAKIKSMCGFFNKHGRVRILKLRGQYSMGFIAGVDSLVNYDPTLKDTDWESLVGTQFDYIDDKEFCHKYIPMINGRRGQNQNHDSKGKSIWKWRMRKLKKFNRLVDGQFEFHYSTKMLPEHINEFKPDDIVAISTKIHGTSVILSNILVNRKLSIWEKIKKFFGFKVPMTEYGNIYSSRSVIKNQYLDKDRRGFYGVDIWGCVNRDFSPYLSEGMTVYGEIAGYLENSTKMIQKQHDYGCKPGHWKFMPYRITETDVDGNKKEWELAEVDAWTHKLVEEHPELADKTLFLDIIYQGRFGDMYPDVPEDENWNKNILARMKGDRELILMEEDEPMCKNKVPREGVVVRLVNDQFARAWKLKSARHYSLEAKQHDNGEVDMEEADSSQEENA